VVEVALLEHQVKVLVDLVGVVREQLIIPVTELRELLILVVGVVVALINNLTQVVVVGLVLLLFDIGINNGALCKT
jgi:hypothetical protein